LYSIFAFESINLKSLTDQINKYHVDNVLDSTQKIDLVCVLKKGMIFHQIGKHMIPFATKTSEMEGKEADESKQDNVLKYFFGSLTNVLSAAHFTSGINYSEYYQNKPADIESE